MIPAFLGKHKLINAPVWGSVTVLKTRIFRLKSRLDTPNLTMGSTDLKKAREFGLSPYTLPIFATQ
jgi:hypothetical protein